MDRSPRKWMETKRLRTEPLGFLKRVKKGVKKGDLQRQKLNCGR